MLFRVILIIVRDLIFVCLPFSYHAPQQEVKCFNVVHAEARQLSSFQPGLCNILTADLAVPVHAGAITTRSHAALHILGTLNVQVSRTVFRVRSVLKKFSKIDKCPQKVLIKFDDKMSSKSPQIQMCQVTTNPVY